MDGLITNVYEFGLTEKKRYFLQNISINHFVQLDTNNRFPILQIEYSN